MRCRYPQELREENFRPNGSKPLPVAQDNKVERMLQQSFDADIVYSENTAKLRHSAAGVRRKLKTTGIFIRTVWYFYE